MKKTLFQLLCTLLFGLSLIATALAAPYEFSADQFTQSFETNKKHGWGHVRIEYQGQVFTADDVEIDDATNDLKAKGHVTVKKGTLNIEAQTADMNLNTGFGSFGDAILHSGGMYVEGRKLGSYAPGHYRVEEGKLSLCKDCPQSWSVTGAYMDIEIDGFAEIHHALIQIRDVPVFYSPLYYLPVKTTRQSGFLVPRYVGMPDLGASITVPYFWAISKNADATFDNTYMAKGGFRLGSESRYYYSDRSFIEAYNSYALNKFNSTRINNRFGSTVAERFQLTPNLTQRFRSEWVRAGDPYYTIDFPGDFPSSGLAALESEPSLAWQTGNIYAYGLARFYRDNLPRDPNVIRSYSGLATNFPGVLPFQGEVNNAPDVGFSIPAYTLWGPVQLGTDLRYTNFHRAGTAVDPFTNLIREGERATAQMRLTSTHDVFDMFQWKPSLELRGDAYAFPREVVKAVPGATTSAYRARLLIDQTFGTDFGRVWSSDLGNLKAVKHVVSPYVRWSYSPHGGMSNHPFFSQGENGFDSPRFDIFDPIAALPPYNTLGTASEEQRLQPNQLLTLGVNTRVIGRYGDKTRTYEEFLVAGISRDLDLMHLDPSGHHPWSPLRINARGAYAGFVLSTNITLDPHGSPAYNAVTEASYTWSRYSVGVSQTLASDQNLYNAHVGVTNWGPWSASISGQYAIKQLGQTDTEPGISLDDFRLSYGSPSKCWYLNTATLWDRSREPNHWSRVIEVGFIFSESGEHTPLNSLVNRKATPGSNL